MKSKLLLLSAILLTAAQCGPKTTRLDVPAGYAEAQTATQEELLELINSRYADVRTLTVSNFRVEFTGGSVEEGYLKEYPSGKGYLAASRPDSIYMNILNPLTSSTVVAMAATEGNFEIWVPKENKYLTGRTNLELEDQEPLYSVRPEHMLQAILIEPVPRRDPRYRYFVEQERDAVRKYYVVGIFDLEGDDDAVCLVRKIWIERAGLRLAKQRYYDCGEPISVIDYGGAIDLNPQLVSSDISVERMRERYRLRLKLSAEAVRVDPQLKENAFHIPRPPGAELVVVEGDSE